MTNVVVVPRGDRSLLGGPRIMVLADHKGKCHLVNMGTGQVYWCCEDTKKTDDDDVYLSEKYVEDYVDADVQDDGTLRLLRHQPDQNPQQINFLSGSQDEILQCLKNIYGNNVIVTKNYKDFNVDYNTGSIITPHASSSNIFRIRRYDYECLVYSNVQPILRWGLRFSTFQCFFPSCCQCYVYHVLSETQFIDICEYLEIKTFADGKTLDQVICQGVIEPKKISIWDEFITLRSDKSILMGRHYEKTTPIMIKSIKRNSIDIVPTIKNITSANTHANILRYYATEVDGDHYHMAFERCSSLKDKLNITDIKSMSLELLTVIRGIVMGIMYLHSKEVVHGQLCPANVLVDNYDVVKIMVMGSLMTNTEDIKEGKLNNVYVVGKLLLYYMTGCSFNFESDNPLQFLYMLPDDAREAKDLITKILNREIVDIGDVSRHCVFWHPETRSSFTRQVSDYLLTLPNDSEIILEVEKGGVSGIIQSRRLRAKKGWFSEFDDKCLDAMGRHLYKTDEVCSLIQLMRDADSNFYELDAVVRKLLAGVADEENILVTTPMLHEEFHRKFPGLLVHLKNIACTYLYQEFKEYFEN